MDKELFQDRFCVWRLDSDHYDDSNGWVSGCDEIFKFYEGDPKNNRFRFCPFCGKELVFDE